MDASNLDKVIDPASSGACERMAAAHYLRHLATLRPADENGLLVAASDIECGFHRDPELNPDKAWPAGDPREVEHREAISGSLEHVRCAPTISRGDLDGLDEIVSFFDTMGQWINTSMYDGAWNLRNHLVPFKPGDKHYDAEVDEEAEVADG